MRILRHLYYWTFVAAVLTRVHVLAWTREEHRLLADSALSSIVQECDTCANLLRIIDLNPTEIRTENHQPISNAIFGKVVEQTIVDEYTSSRFHVRGATIFAELRFMPNDMFRQALGDASDLAFDPKYSGHLLSKASKKADNVVANYLINHLIALVKARLANTAPTHSVKELREAMYWEATAQGYLADAFSSSHMVLSMHSPLSLMPRRNNREASKAFAKRGWYMLNSRGDVWQGFGDGRLAWYSSTYEPVLEACVMSLREVFITYLGPNESLILAESANWAKSLEEDPETNRNFPSGWDRMSRAVGYLDPQEGECFLPTLRLVPMPVTATWSEKRAVSGSKWRSERQQFPQLAEEHLHDTSLHYLDNLALYSSNDVPAWMIPEPLRGPSPTPADSFIKSDPDWASVQYLQDFNSPIIPRGLQIHISEQTTLSHGSGMNLRMGLGYGFHIPKFVLLDPLSVQAEIIPRFFDAHHSLYSISAGLGVLDILKGQHDLLPDFFRVDVGYGFGSDGDSRVHGIMVAPAIDYNLTSFGSFNVGLRLCIAYRWYLLKPTVGGIGVGVVFM